MKENIDEIIDKIGTVANENGSESDVCTLKEWVESNPHALSVLENLSDEDFMKDKMDKYRSDRKYKSAGRLKLKINKRKRIKLFVRIASAAAVVLLTAYMYPLFLTNEVVQEPVVVESQPFVTPETIKAPTVILSSGDMVKVAEDVELSRLISEERKGQDINLKMVEMEHNTLVVPHKFIRKIILDDGSEVMVNADSKLKFPLKFRGEKREVELEGEAYFVVAKESRPFVVNVNGVKIRVYGTKFNVNSFKKGYVETVLEQGSIGVVINKNGAEIERMIVPEELSVADINNGENSVSKVDIAKYVAWTNGHFSFDDDKLEDIFNTLSRWYGVKFIYDESLRGMDEKSLVASFRRDTPIDEVLEVLKHNMGLTIERNDNIINVKKIN